MLVGDALDEALALKGVQAVDDRLVGGDTAGLLDFPQEGGPAVLSKIAMKIV